MRIIILLLLLSSCCCHALQQPSTRQQQLSRTTAITRRWMAKSARTNEEDPDKDNDRGTSTSMSRQRFVRATAAALFSSFWSGFFYMKPAAAADDEEQQQQGLNVIKTGSGLKYIDLQVGSGPSPDYGNFVSIGYTAYIKLPTNSQGYSTQPQQFDKTDSYLIKHGNGRMIAGLDEGLHTMKVGGKRRLLIPPKLGYVDVGLGPLPEMPWRRYTLNKLLDQMITVSGGTVIYEITLNNVIQDEADQGYYQDSSLSLEEFELLKENLRRKGNAQLEKEAAVNSLGVTGGDRVR